MRIAFLGDIALIGKYNLLKNKDAKNRLKKVADKLSEFDYVICNLETPLTNKNNTKICKSMHLKSPKINVELLKYLNIDAVSIANNHLYDYGKQGLIDTIEVLQNNDIEWFGANRVSLNKTICGENLSFSGFCGYDTNASGYITKFRKTGVNPLTYNSVMEQLKLDRKNNSLSILSFHWGNEHTNYPNLDQIKIAKNISKQKDILLYGHHSHVMQGLQEINSSLIAYSLGNFLFDDCSSINGNFELKQTSKNKKSFILDVKILNNKIFDYNYTGIVDKENGIDFCDIENELDEISNKLYNINDINSYNRKRVEQIKKERFKKLGKRDFKWFLSRLNYYSIGALLKAKLRKYKQKKEISNFLNEG